MKVAMTGTSGNWGREALEQVLTLKEVEFVRVLLSQKKKNDKLEKQYKKRYGARIEVVRGTVSSEENCKKLVKAVDYVIHLAAVIPPLADKNPRASYECNYRGTVAIVNAIKAENPQPSYVHISTMALYGNRNEKHLWARVGDPLLVSTFDGYAMHKLAGERYVLDAELERWAVLRQTAMLHPNMLNDNVSDGLMFHTCLNSPLEWVSSRDSGYLIKRILERDHKGEVPTFWCNVYNIGAGKKGMNTGYDTFKDGFSLIGGSAEKFFKPDWLATRNFHGAWFLDGDELERYFQFQRDGVTEFWKEIGRRHKIFALAKLIPAKLVKRFLFKRLLDHPNSPRRWVKDGDRARVQAYFGGEECVKALPANWSEVKLIAKGDFGDYDGLRDVELAKKTGNYLLHGYDESKPMSELTIADMCEAALFRGGKCLSPTMQKGDIYRKLQWQCQDGHTFEASPMTVLRAGHWCPKCGQPTPWDFDRLAKNNPFYAQVWYDSHAKNEDMCYDFDADGNAVMTELPQ